MPRKFRSSPRSSAAGSLCILLLALTLLFSSACKRGPLRSGEVAYVAVPQAVLRDRVAPIFNKVGTVSTGEKLEVLDHQRRFVKVRTSRKEEGWVEQRFLISEDIYKSFEKLDKENASTPVQARGATRAELNMHLTAARDSEKLYQLAEGEKIDILKRATAERPAPGAAGTKPAPLSDKSKREAKPSGSAKSSSKVAQQPANASTANAGSSSTPAGAASGANSAPAQPAEPKPMDDWWLVRNKQGHVGWVLARMVDMDIPMEIAQYAEGQRIQGSYPLNQVQDEDKTMNQYLVVMNEPKDGLPYDFNSFRIFTWNLRRHRYETAYRERNVMGFFPVKTGTQAFDKLGTLPTFTLNLQNEDGSVTAHTYRLEGPLVRRVLAPGEEAKKTAEIQKEPRNKKLKEAARRHRSH